MLPQEVDSSSGLWSNNSSNASLHEYTLPQQSENNNRNSIGLGDISVGDILEIYKHDTELLKHILMAKAEEDKRRAAEEVRRTEEARLQSKYLDLGWEQQKRISDPSAFTNDFLSGSLGSLAVSSTDGVSDWLSIPPNNTISTLSPSPMAASLCHFDQTPPSPTTSYYRPPSPLTTTSFDVPFADLTISTQSSPEPLDSSSNKNKTKPSSPSSVKNINTSNRNSLPPPPPPPPHDDTTNDDHIPPTKSACKRTLSRTRSQRRPHVPGKKKNRSLTLPQQQQQPEEEESESLSVKDEPQLDHDRVMEALRAKLRRSSNPPTLSSGDKSSLSSNNNLIWPSSDDTDHPPQPMSPQGMLLLDLKNPRKVFPTVSSTNSSKRTTMNPRVAVLRRPRPFTSAHNHCEKSKDTSTTTPVTTK
ncbi:uncharacterized protein BX664DRAFT_326346 [Halteromyces radiatus]|uniref:uncharacterized protein n=1 Tax=Halteromyces radiatus TaxID=101107 RepID=UPI00221ECE79|nr:uncharacterized protein BX664DRAFT_326346 [Halteromyces radiatus]KAI8097426.1 hypothetical protein BX664DRAFT_326346 [Halteromyces radiatus]